MSIHIALISDDQSTIQTSVAITSLVKNKNPGSNYKIYIVSPGLSTFNRERLLLQRDPTVEIVIINSSQNADSELNIESRNTEASAAPTLHRKVASLLLIPDSKKVLYLDNEIIVRSDLSHLYNFDISKQFAAAVYDPLAESTREEATDQVDSCLNTGVMLLNLDLMRTEKILEKIAAFEKACPVDSLLDLETLFNGRVLRLPKIIKIHILNSCEDLADVTKNEQSKSSGPNDSDFPIGIESADIILFPLKEKPWKKINHPLSDEWFNYFWQSPFGSTNQGMQNFDSPPVVSVIIPVYDVEPYLFDCLCSVINQTLNNIEIIVINDGSTDDSQSILQEFMNNDGRIKGVIKENGGLSSARNAGLRIASGKYIYFLDSDDMISYDALACLSEESEKNNLDVLYFEGISFFETDEIAKKFWFRKTAELRDQEYYDIVTGPELFVQMHENGEYRPSACIQFIEKAFLDDIGLVFDEKIKYHEDNLFTFMCIMNAKRVKHILKPFFYRRLRNDSITTKQPTASHAQGYLHSLSEIFTFCQNREFDDETTGHINKLLSLFFVKALKIFSNLSETEKQDFGNNLDQFSSWIYEVFLKPLTKEKLSEIISRESQKFGNGSEAQIHKVNPSSEEADLRIKGGFKFKFSGMKLIYLITKVWNRLTKHRSIKSQLSLIENSGLFDREWYLKKYPEIAKAHIDPMKHYLLHGGFEGRNPGPYFNSKMYIKKNPGVNTSGLNPLVHYLIYGKEMK